MKSSTDDQESNENCWSEEIRPNGNASSPEDRFAALVQAQQDIISRYQHLQSSDAHVSDDIPISLEQILAMFEGTETNFASSCQVLELVENGDAPMPEENIDSKHDEGVHDTEKKKRPGPEVIVDNDAPMPEEYIVTGEVTKQGEKSNKTSHRIQDSHRINASCPPKNVQVHSQLIEVCNAPQSTHSYFAENSVHSEADLARSDVAHDVEAPPTNEFLPGQQFDYEVSARLIPGSRVREGLNSNDQHEASALSPVFDAVPVPQGSRIFEGIADSNQTPPRPTSTPVCDAIPIPNQLAESWWKKHSLTLIVGASALIIGALVASVGLIASQKKSPSVNESMVSSWEERSSTSVATPSTSTKIPTTTKHPIEPTFLHDSTKAFATNNALSYKTTTTPNPTKLTKTTTTTAASTRTSTSIKPVTPSPTSAMPAIKSTVTTPVTPSIEQSFSEKNQFLAPNGPIPTRIRLIDPTIANGYQSCDGLKDDIRNALHFLANSVISGEFSNDYYEKCDPTNPTWWQNGPDHEYGYAEEDESPPMTVAAEEVQGESNHQVKAVDEADIVKSDGNWVFAGYGDILYVWNATNGPGGISITRLSNDDTKVECDDYLYYPKPIAEDGDEDDCCGKPKPQILALLFQGNRVAAIVSEKDYCHVPNDEAYVGPIVSDYSKLSIRVYDASNIPTNGDPLPLLGVREIKGKYNSARSFGSTGIVISTSYLNTYQFVGDLYRYQDRYCGLNATQYEALAAEIALNTTDDFVERMVDELQVDGSCNSIFQISALQSGSNSTDNTNENLLQNFVQVLSFDMNESFVDENITTHVAGAFASGYLSSVYVSRDFAATLNVGHSYNPSTNDWEQSTFILGFDIGGALPEPMCVGEVPGSPINQYAADLYEGHLRVATTEWRWNQVDFSSRTTNKIFVLKIPVSDEWQQLQLTGVTPHVGKENESIFAVRFIGDKAYVVTFEQIDPFIIVDVSNHSDPHVAGELEIPGFSSYLHPITIDGTEIILGLGQHVDTTCGWKAGVKISLFNITDSTNPKEMTNYIECNANSNGQHNFKSFQYLPVSQKLLLPKSEWTYTEEGNFDGFLIYDVSATHIIPSHEISHASSVDMYRDCWYSAYMPPRSFVLKSKVTTILSHTVVSTDLNTCAEEWRLTLDGGLGANGCAPYFKT